jgi:hypothetical protein
LNLCVLSVGEKAGIPTIGRYEAIAFSHQRKEFEYTRHKTTSLIAERNIANGQLINAHLR